MEFDLGNCPAINQQCWPSGGLPFQPDDYFDDTASSNPSAYFSKYLYEASFGHLQVIGDYVKNVVHIPCSSIINSPGSPYNGYPNYSILFSAIETELNANNGKTFHGHPINEFDNYDFSVFNTGFPKPQGSNNNIDFIIICYGNSNGLINCNSGHVAELEFFQDILY